MCVLFGSTAAASLHCPFSLPSQLVSGFSTAMRACATKMLDELLRAKKSPARSLQELVEAGHEKLPTVLAGYSALPLLLSLDRLQLPTLPSGHVASLAQMAYPALYWDPAALVALSADGDLPTQYVAKNAT